MNDEFEGDRPSDAAPQENSAPQEPAGAPG